MDFESKRFAETDVEKLHEVEDKGDLRDFIAFVLGGAVLDFDNIDYLAPDNQLDLEKGFRILRAGLHKLYSNELDPQKFLRAEEYLNGSLSAFRIQDHHTGARLLYEFEQTLFRR